MDTDFTLVLLIGALAFLALYLRTNIALALLTACAGYVVADLSAGSIVDIIKSAGFDSDYQTTLSFVAIALTVLPSLFVLFRFRRFQPGRLFEHITPAIAYSLLLILLVLVWLPPEIRNQLEQDSYVFSQFEYFKTFIVIASVVIAVFDVIAHEQRLRRKVKRGRHRKEIND